MPKQKKSATKTNKPTSLLIIIASALIVIIIGIITIAVIYSNKLKESNKIEPVFSQSEPLKISFTGTITDIKDNLLILDAKASNNDLIQDRKLIINLTDNTEYKRVFIPNELTGDPQKDIMKTINIRKEEIIPGDYITTRGIIKDKIFTADTIEDEQTQ